MTKLTVSQQAAMIKADKQGPVVVIRSVTARALIASGHMQQASIFPTPIKGIAVALTTKGRSWIKHGS